MIVVKKEQEAREVVEQGLSRQQAAELLGVKASLLANWAVFGRALRSRNLPPADAGKSSI